MRRVEPHGRDRIDPHPPCLVRTGRVARGHDSAPDRFEQFVEAVAAHRRDFHERQFLLPDVTPQTVETSGIVECIDLGGDDDLRLRGDSGQVESPELLQNGVEVLHRVSA